MKTLLTLLTVLLLTSCAAFDRLVDVADVTISVPTARAELESYLTPEQLLDVADELALLDRTYQPIADAVYGDVDITLESALTQALGAAANQARLEAAYKAIRTQVRQRALSGTPVPAELSRVSEQIESLWNDWESVTASNQRAARYIEVAARIALPL